MKIIRHSVFETNSSSSHSISIADKCEVYQTIYPNGDGEIILEGGDFGWENDFYSDSWTKANYCAQDGIDDEMLERVIKNHTGAKKVIINLGDYCSIDHQSIGTSEAAFESDETLKRFLFSPN